MQEDPETYSKPIDEEDEEYKNWIQNFNLDAKTDEISDLLKKHEHISEIHRSFGLTAGL